MATIFKQKLQSSVESFGNETKNQKLNKKTALYKNAQLIQTLIQNFEPNKVGYSFSDSKVSASNPEVLKNLQGNKSELHLNEMNQTKTKRSQKFGKGHTIDMNDLKV